MLRALLCTLALLAPVGDAVAEGLGAERLGILINQDDPASEPLARYYAARRGVPRANIVALHLGRDGVVSPPLFGALRAHSIDQLPAEVQSLLLVWTKPFAVGCMSVTTAFAAGYRAAFCEPGCAATAPNPLFDAQGWLPADTVGWWPAMLIPTDDAALAHALIDRGLMAQAQAASGAVYLVSTHDPSRNVRAKTYGDVKAALSKQLRLVELTTPISAPLGDALAYFTGTVRVEELNRIHFVPGAVADHLTSAGGVLVGGDQMSAVAWLQQGATASYGTVSEPCNHLEKFPAIEILLKHYLRGETVLEAYWKSVAMPGQGLFVGEPLARPFATHRPPG